jgi:hypothetical protein
VYSSPARRGHGGTLRLKEQDQKQFRTDVKRLKKLLKKLLKELPK